jgi:hypothetical protein
VSRKLDWFEAPKGGTLEFPWPAGTRPLALAHDGRGKPWVTITSRAALPLKAPLSSGYSIKRTLAPVEQKTRGEWTRGDVYRVTLEIEAQSDMIWVVVSDPIPAGAAILGTGLGRDSAEGQMNRRIHRTLEQRRRLRPAGDARRGDVCAGDVRRDPQREGRGDDAMSTMTQKLRLDITG